MATIEEAQNIFINEFNEIDDWMFQYECLLRISAEVAGLNEAEKCESNLVQSCQSKLWLICENRNGKIHIRADSEALIIKGITGIIIQLLNNRTLQEIIDADINFIHKTVIQQQISTDRSNGIQSVIQKIKEFAETEIQPSASKQTNPCPTGESG